MVSKNKQEFVIPFGAATLNVSDALLFVKWQIHILMPTGNILGVRLISPP